MKFDLDSFCRENIRPGANHNVSGPRGNGKTYFSVAIAENVVKGLLPCSTTSAVCFTNVVFERKIGPDEFIVDYPPAVRYFGSFIELLSGVGEVLREYGVGNVTIIVMLDEAQNYMLSDKNGSDENMALIKFMGNTRKFGICTFFMTPTRKNLVPRIRGFEDSDEAGYCTVEWKKDNNWAAEYIRKYRLNWNPRDIIAMRMSDDDEPMPVEIPRSTWGRKPETIRTGEFVYQTLAAADFAVGTNEYGAKFEIEHFLKRISGRDYRKVPALIEDYFAEFEKKGAKKGTEGDSFLQENARICEIIDRMRIDKVTWPQIERYIGEAEHVLKYRYKKFFELYPSRKISLASVPEKEEKEGRATRVYIKPNLKEASENADDFSERVMTENGGTA